MINSGCTEFMIDTRLSFVVETRTRETRRSSGSSRKKRESQLFGRDADLAQERRDSGPLRGRGSETRTCVLDKGDAAFRFVKGHKLIDPAFEPVQERGLQNAAFKSCERTRTSGHNSELSWNVVLAR